MEKKNNKAEPYVTKISRILLERSMTQSDLIELIKSVTGEEIEKYSISNIVTGRKIYYHAYTAWLIAISLGVKMEDILEFKRKRLKRSKSTPVKKK